MTVPFRAPRIKVLTSEQNTNNTDVKNSATATVNVYSDAPDNKVIYGEEKSVIDPIPEINENPYPEGLTRSVNSDINVYKLLLEAYMNNPLRVNNYIVMNGKDLCELVKRLTGAEQVEITSETDINCCGKPSIYNTIQGIVIVQNDGTRLDFEVSYNKEFRLLKDYKISTLLTYDVD